jgi:hypothetical protein
VKGVGLESSTKTFSDWSLTVVFILRLNELNFVLMIYQLLPFLCIFQEPNEASINGEEAIKVISIYRPVIYLYSASSLINLCSKI